MGKANDHISEQHLAFIEKQKLFFVATAPLSGEGHINLSPKGLEGFKVLSSNRVAYMDFTGSGNETSAHILENGRITIMFCSFDKVPNILRLYGKGFAVLRSDPLWEELAPHFNIYPSTRQIIVADITRVSTSCGYGIPVYEFKADRSILFDWAEKKGEEGIRDYIDANNLYSIDRLPTAILQDKLKQEE